MNDKDLFESRQEAACAVVRFERMAREMEDRMVPWEVAHDAVTSHEYVNNTQLQQSEEVQRVIEERTARLFADREMAIKRQIDIIEAFDLTPELIERAAAHMAQREG